MSNQRSRNMVSTDSQQRIQQDIKDLIQKSYIKSNDSTDLESATMRIARILSPKYSSKTHETIGEADTLKKLQQNANVKYNDSIDLKERFVIRQHETVGQVDSFKKLKADLKRIYDSSLFTDVTLQVGKQTISAHRAILCGRSPVFSKMFKHETSEEIDCIINITDIEFDVFKKFIAFLYSCEFKETDIDSLCGLYYVADKYEVLDLRGLCATTLISLLNVDNACPILALADRHGDEHLKKKTMEFMSTRLKDVARSKYWTKYINSRLASEIITNSR